MKKYKSPIKKFGTLEIEAGADKFNNLFRYVEFFLKALLGIIILLAVLGFFGSGMLTRMKVSNELLSAEFNKFIRVQSSDSFIITVNLTHQNNSDTIQLWVSQNLIKKTYLKDVSPKPLFEEAGTNGILYTFKTARDLQALPIKFTIEPLSAGIIEQKFVIKSSAPLIFRQVIYP